MVRSQRRIVADRDQLTLVRASGITTISKRKVAPVPVDPCADLKAQVDKLTTENAALRYKIRDAKTVLQNTTLTLKKRIAQAVAILGA
jgi:hypothetical protein